MNQDLRFEAQCEEVPQEQTKAGPRLEVRHEQSTMARPGKIFVPEKRNQGKEKCVSFHLHGPGSEEYPSRVKKAPRAEPMAHRHSIHSHNRHCLEPGLSPSSSEPSRAVPSSQQPGNLSTKLLTHHPPALTQMSRTYRLMGFCCDDLYCIRIPYNQIAVRAHCYSPFSWIQVEDFGSISARHSHKLVFIHLSSGLLTHKKN